MASFPLLEILFPKRCVGCGRFGTYLCRSCRTIQQLHLPQVCPACERPAIDGRTHPVCRSKFGLDGLYVIFVYQPPVSLLVKHLKYRFARDVAGVLVDWAALELAGQRLWNSPTLVPIPAHRLRNNWRGFNHTALIGQALAKRIGWNYQPQLLLRTKIRPPQTKLKGKQRRQNVRGIFQLVPNVSISQCPNILLFDDVWTTGSTMKEAAGVLKRFGAKSVWGLAVSR